MFNSKLLTYQAGYIPLSGFLYPIKPHGKPHL
jgi:hypothetical protein